MLPDASAVFCLARLSPFGEVVDNALHASPLMKRPYDGPWLANIQLRLADLMSFNPTLLALSILACTMTVAGCACNPVGRDLHPARHKGIAPLVHIGAHPDNDLGQPRLTESRVHLPKAALLARQPQPDCEFKGANVETMDATELTRLKIEYERQCFQNAEKAARDRLGLLQAAVQHMRD
jgi:hypothetical protein